MERKIIFIEGPHVQAAQLPLGWYIADVDTTGEFLLDTLIGPFKSVAAAEKYPEDTY